MDRHIEVSVVVPVFNERENVRALYTELRESLKGTLSASEVLVVDDGSTDGTFEALRAISAGDERFKIIRFRQNYGQAAALQAGFDHAVGNIVVTMDGDLQNDPADIATLVDEIKNGYDVVSGWRRDRKEPLLTRRIPSQTANALIAWLTGVPVHDNGCTLRAYRRDIVQSAHLYAEMHRFLVPILTLSGCRLNEVPVRDRPRRFGYSKYGLSRVWKVFLDLISLKMLLRFVSHPAAWFALLGFPFSVAAILAGAGSLFLFASGAEASRSPIVFVSVTVLLSFAAAHLLLLGMFAEVIVKTGDYRESDPIVPRIERSRLWE